MINIVANRGLITGGSTGIGYHLQREHENKLSRVVTGEKYEVV